MTSSRWRSIARKAIDDALAATVGATPAEQLAAIDAAYPFGAREHWPYKMWLKERAIARERVSPPNGAAGRVCGACGAKRGKPCRDIETNAMLSTFHDARATPTSGALFGEP